MKATHTKIRADLRQRRLQTLIIAIVVLLSSGPATLALSLTLETDAPYDHAFAQANGAHLIVTYDGRHASPAHLRATASAPGVTATAGPWPLVIALYSDSSTNNAGFTPAGNLFLVGRRRPDTGVDRLTVESGRWARAPGEIVITQSLADHWGAHLGDVLTSGAGGRAPSLTVVGIAAPISPYADGWVIPSAISRMVNTHSPLQYLMDYRVTPHATTTELQDATQRITAHLPSGSVVNVANYLDAKRNADTLSAVMVPFLLAFSIFALVASVLIISNVVGGAIVAGYREIGIMKAVGFTPGQVMTVFLAGILAPVLLGCLLGIPLGTIASQPFLQQTARAMGLPAPFSAAVPVDLAVLVLVLAVAMLTALVPAWRAGHLSAVRAITMGSAPSVRRGSLVADRLAFLPGPRPLSLGLADALARPLRSATTLGAILIGVALVAFALSLHLSVSLVAAHLIRDSYVPVSVDRPPPGGYPGIKRDFGSAPAAPSISDQQTSALLRSNPYTAKFAAETQEQIRIAGLAQPITYYAYRGPSSWTGYALISGRWFSRPGEVVAPTKLMTQAHLHLGQKFTAVMHGKLVRLRLVGEILDQADGDLLLRGTFATLHASDPTAQPYSYEVQLKPGVSAQAFAGSLLQQLRQTAGNGPIPLSVNIAHQESTDSTVVVLNGVIAGLALVLISIAVAGVFNTIVLSTREKARDIAILKVVGMGPRQVVGMVIAAVVFLGFIAGGLGTPLGLLLHARIIMVMAQAALGSNVPPSFLDPIAHAELPLLALAGVVIAAIGAWIPAQWAASSRVTEVLQAE